MAELILSSHVKCVTQNKWGQKLFLTELKMQLPPKILKYSTLIIILNKIWTIEGFIIKVKLLLYSSNLMRIQIKILLNWIIKLAMIYTETIISHPRGPNSTQTSDIILWNSKNSSACICTWLRNAGDARKYYFLLANLVTEN